jgi:heat shock protein HtpX
VNSFLKTTLLLASLTGLLVGMGYVLGGPSLALVALIFAGIMNFVAYFFSDKLALSMAGAKEVTAQEEPELHRMVAEVARLSEMPMPKVFVVQNESPNAFATGRNPEHAVVAVTTGIRRILTDRELRAVIGHEMGHVKNRDILTSSIAATIAGAISYLGMMAFWMGGMFGGRDGDRPNPLFGLLMFIFAPIAAGILQMALSRTREYAADRSGAEYTHDPMSLASALSKLQSGVAMRPMEQNAGAQAISSLYIVHPFNAGGLGNLFSTHPPMEERIKRLEEMARNGIQAR